MDRQRGRSMQLQARDELIERGLWSYVEPILTMGSAAIAEPVSGLVGLAALPYGVDAATRAIHNTQEAMTYQPRTEAGQANVQAVGEALQPVGDAFIGASEYLGDGVYDATGSPALATAAYSVPTLALEALGLKGASKLSKGRAYEMADISDYTKGLGGKQRGIFAGVKAKGADLDAMEAAKELAVRGVSRDEIWNKTGWFEDVDGAWKWEIDDSGAAFDMTPSLDAQKRGAPYSERFPFIGESIDHRQLLGYQDSAYDDLDNIRLQVDGKTTKGGSYGQSASLAEGINPKGEFIELSDDLLGGDAKSVALHELQHAIQEREGFAGGGSPSQFADDFAQNRARLAFLEKDEATQAILKEVDDAENALIMRDDLDFEQMQKELFDLQAYYRQVSPHYKEYSKVMHAMRGKSEDGVYEYKRLAGEAEARNVQTRLDYTPEQRRATPPWQTLDVPEDELIVRRDGGVAQSVAFDSSTGYPDIDARISKVEDMTPDEYLRQAFSATDGALGGDFDDWMRSNARSAEDVDAYAKAMQEGDKFPLTYIDFDAGSQDGRNRALAAKKAGAKTIPVGIIEKRPAVERIAEIKEEMKSAKGYGLHRLTEELARLERDIK